MSGPTSSIDTQIPGFFAIYQPDSPIAITLPLDQQITELLDASRLAEYNLEAARCYGIYPPASARGLTMSELAGRMTSSDYNAVRAILRDHLRDFVANRYRLEDLAITWQLDGVERHFMMSYYGFVDDGCLQRMLVLYRDDTSTYYQKELVNAIAQSLAAESGETFFNHLVSELAQTLRVDYALVAQKLPDSNERVKILSFYDRVRGKTLMADSEYTLTTLVGQGVLEGETCVYPDGLQARYGDNARVRALDVESFIAVPILGEHSQVLGVIALMNRTPMHSARLLESVLNIFSIRVSAEMERRRVAEQAQRRQLQQQLFIDNSTSGMFVADIDPPMPLDLPVQRQVQWLADNSRFVDANPAFIDLFQFRDRAHLVGRSLFGEQMRYDFATTIRDFIAQDFRFQDHLIRFYAEDHELWASANASGIVEDGKLMQILGMMTDVTDRVQHSQAMEYRAKHDSLTGLPNRRFFMDMVDQSRRLSPPGSKHALLLLDLDGFKEVNDTLGHEIGDFLLKQIGPRLRDLLPNDTSIMARLGGDEFAIFVENYRDKESIKSLALRLMDAIKTPFSISELELVIGGSVGIALYPENAESVSSLLRCADVAMYQAKKHADAYRFYATEQDHYTVRRLSLMMDIRQAIDNDELRLFYQPIVNLGDRMPVSFEALIRWQHPQHGMLSPAEFIPLIEITDMIVPVTWWVVDTAVRQLAAWKARGWPYRISVNVSARNLIDAGFSGFVADCLRRHDVEGRHLEVEITESTLMVDPEKSRQVLQAISALGCQVSIDDYGTGYSSLGYLKSLPINTLKIDRSFISQMLTDSQDQIIVNSTIQLAHNLGLDVTAEGIEDLQLVETLGELGCDKGQGFYFCRPIPVAELEQWLELHSRAAVSGEN